MVDDCKNLNFQSKQAFRFYEQICKNINKMEGDNNLIIDQKLKKRELFEKNI